MKSGHFTKYNYEHIPMVSIIEEFHVIVSKVTAVNLTHVSTKYINFLVDGDYIILLACYLMCWSSWSSICD